MTREEAIQVLKQYRTIVMNCLETKTPAFDMAIEALSTNADIGEYADHLWKIAYERGKAEADWIPCSEKLPEDGVDVLITTENEEVYIDQVITDPFKERYFQSNTAYDNFQVVAWMPLPTPYKGGDDE